MIDYMGIVWEFHLKKVNNLLYFSLPRYHFFDHHVLENNWFLVVYNENSTFEVMIFHLLAVEFSYENIYEDDEKTSSLGNSSVQVKLEWRLDTHKMIISSDFSCGALKYVTFIGHLGSSIASM